MKKKCLMLSLAALMFVTLFSSEIAFCSSDLCTLAQDTLEDVYEPWYKDGDFSWFSPYLYTLWQEKVTDGLVLGSNTAYFYPDHEITHAQLAMLLCKVFSYPSLEPAMPSYPDVPRSYEIFRRKPAWKWIEGALAAGILFVPAGQLFHPDSYMARQDIVELVIRSLNLCDYARSLAEDEVQNLLNRFKDGHTVSAERRRSMASAIKLDIIRGFDDKTIRPKQNMTRAEAVTVIYRCCLIRVRASLDLFSPDGDGIDDTVDFLLGYLKNRGISDWQMVVTTASGKTVKRFNPEGLPGAPPTVLTWDGRDDSGKKAVDGVYYYQAWVKDRRDRQFLSVLLPLEIQTHSLSAYLSPTICKDGDTLTIRAHTRPEGVMVRAVLGDGRTWPLKPSPGNTVWTVAIAVDQSFPYGSQEITAIAQFPRARREATLAFLHEQSLWIVPDITPNPACPPVMLHLNCRAPDNVISVVCLLLGQEISLIRDPQTGLWHNTFLLSSEVSDGSYPAVFTGTTESCSVRETLTLEVDRTRLLGLTYILTR